MKYQGINSGVVEVSKVMQHIKIKKHAIKDQNFVHVHNIICLLLQEFYSLLW